MRSRIAFLICFTFALVISINAQTKVVTNNDLESYKQKRLQSDREYRENYARLGRPSPEEIDRRLKESRAEMEQLSAQFGAEDLERQRIEAQLRANAQLAAMYYQYAQSGFEPLYVDGTIYSSYYGRRNRFPIRQRYSQPGYFAGGQFWPTGSSTPPRPMFGGGRRR